MRDKAIDKDVKTIDGEKVGKIRAVTRDYIQIQKGKVDKKYHFVPKHYIQGFDGDDIWLAINEDEVKQFESEKELPLTSFDTPQYRERRSNVEKQHPKFSTAIPSYSSGSDSAQEKVGMRWEKVIDKEVKSADDKDLGEVKSIGAEYIEVKEGKVSKKHYFIPKTSVGEFDGNKLRVTLTNDEIKDRFERDSPLVPAEFESNKHEDKHPERS